MPMYTFFLCSGDGGAASFESFELGCDEFAPARALKLLAEHPSCSYVAVWDGERPVAVRERPLELPTAAKRTISHLRLV